MFLVIDGILIPQMYDQARNAIYSSSLLLFFFFPSSSPSSSISTPSFTLFFLQRV